MESGRTFFPTTPRCLRAGRKKPVPVLCADDEVRAVLMIKQAND